MDESAYPRKWIHSLSLQPLFISKTSRIRASCYIVFWFFMLIRFVIMMVVKSESEYRLTIGLIFYPLGSTSMMINLAGVAYASLIIVIHLTLLFGSGSVLNTFMDKELSLIKKEDVELLEGYLRMKFLKLLKVTFIGIDCMIKMSLWCLSMIFVYLAVVCASRETSVTSMGVWIFWSTVHIVFCAVSSRFLFWSCGLWYLRKQHLIYQIDQITHDLATLM